MRSCLLICVVALAGCASNPPAPVVDLSSPGEPRRSATPPPRATPRAPSPAPDEHVVTRDETLYGVAFRHGLDHRELAAWNGIAAPAYRLRPGQRLRLTPPPRPLAVRGAPAPLSAPAGVQPVGDRTGARPVESDAAAVTIEPLPPEPLAAQPAPRPAPARTPAPSPSAPVAPVRARPSAAPVAPPLAAPTPTEPVQTTIASLPGRTIGGVRWHWPAQGRVVARFVADDPARQGFDIAGTPGQAVYAAADGEVVYSGNGLLGYGELVIIRHNAEFLSAYGHNRRRLVTEGQKVRAGQHIAEMGRSGAAIDLLHFEIRRGGRPVDPGAYLPRR